MYFGTKSYLKNNRNHTAKHTPKYACEKEIKKTETLSLRPTEKLKR
jgi:hypothetical protein